ncbi:MAG: phytanoyl-CoA dioxygenase family protein, partial [Woeseiaceae bacterium]
MTKGLGKAQVEAYERDGFVCIPGFFDAGELEPLLDAYRDDPTINGAMYGMVDNYGAPHPICIWTELGDDIIGMIPRMVRMVEATETLMGEPCYHWHSKITVKPPGCDAHVDWHQDYGSWYDDGVPFPSLLTVGLAIEPATKTNGCLQLVPGSHKIGR